MVAAVLSAGGCRTSACSEAYVLLNGRCFDPTAACDIECGDHEICDITVSPNECRCATGYTGNPCEWAGSVVGDPSFQRVEGGGFWLEEGGRLSPQALGSDEGDQGEAVFRPAAICSAGKVTQVIDMPTYDAAEPLVAEVVYKALFAPGVAIGFGDAWTRLPATGDAYATEAFCLGDAAYWRPDPNEVPAPLGGPVTLRISVSEPQDNCDLIGDLAEIRIDRFVIRPPRAEEEDPCPAPARPPGQTGVINGEADADDGGWAFDCLQAGAPVTCAPGLAATAGFEAGAGRAESSGAKLSRQAGVEDQARATTHVSVPLPSSSISPALAFWWKGTNQRLFPVEIGTFAGFDENGEPDRARVFDTLVGDGGEESNVYCLPPWTHGAVVDLSFALPEDGFTEAVELTVDDVRVVSDPRCSQSDGLHEPGFESAPNSWIGASLRSLDQRVEMKSQPQRARNGSGFLELSYGPDLGTDGARGELSMETYVLVPSTDDTGAPAVALHTNMQVEPSARVEWLLGAADRCRGDLPRGEWERTEICLPPEWSGRWYRLKVKVEPSAEPGAGDDRSWVRLDDIELLTSARCPIDCP